MLWAADLYLKRLDQRQRAEFVEAVKAGQVCLNGTYLNELPGSLPARGTDPAVPPGYTAGRADGKADRFGHDIGRARLYLGVVPAMAQAGIRYFSAGPNGSDRLGTVLREWENKPFYWVGPDGKSKCSLGSRCGYSLSMGYKGVTPQLIDKISDALEKAAALRRDVHSLGRARRQCGARPDDLRRREGLERPLCLAAIDHFRDERGVPRVGGAIRQGPSAGPRRLDALLGGRRRLFGPRDRDKPPVVRPAGRRKAPLGDPQPHPLSLRRLRCGLE